MVQKIICKNKKKTKRLLETSQEQDRARPAPSEFQIYYGNTIKISA